MSDETVPHRVHGVPVKTLRVQVVEGLDAPLARDGVNARLAIGTARDNDLVLTDPTVSRYHLELEHRGDRIDVRDLGSTNGTLVGPARIDQGSVEPGTTLRIGKTALKIQSAATVELELLDGDRLGGLLGRSTVMRKMMADLAKVARSGASVLLLGETGAGKEVVARAVHESSPRAGGPFETVDCGALAPTLIASELFGHEKGAFTGADKQHVGAFERADKGTIFLDEIGELPLALQASLLGAIERRSFKRVGGTKPIDVDVRMICATHRDLRAEVNEGRFRQDLYYRIAVAVLRIPPLRERLEDLPLLIEHFLREAGFQGSPGEIIPEVAMPMLRAHRWPGNVRELRNFVESALAFGRTPELGEPAAGAAQVSGGGLPYLSTPLQELIQMPYKEARARALGDFERVYLTALLERTQDNVSRAARVSDIQRSYLNEMLKRHGLR